MLQKTFNARFRKLYEEAGSPPVQQFADSIGISRQSCANYKDSKETIYPDSKTLLVISEKFNVSLDWLMGKTDVRSTSNDVKNAIQTLGISEKAVENIMNISRKHYDYALSDLISDDGFYQLITGYDDLIKLGEKWRETLPHIKYAKSDAPSQISEDGHITMSIHDALFHYINRVSSTMRVLCEDRIYSPPGQHSAAWMTIDTKKGE